MTTKQACQCTRWVPRGQCIHAIVTAQGMAAYTSDERFENQLGPGPYLVVFVRFTCHFLPRPPQSNTRGPRATFKGTTQGTQQGQSISHTRSAIHTTHTPRKLHTHTFNAAKDMSSSQAGRWYSPSTAAGGVSPPTSRSSKNSAPRSLTWDANRPENVQSSCTGSHGTDAYGFVHHVSVNTNSATYTATTATQPRTYARTG